MARGILKLLVLGGTVFLGRHVVEAALSRGHQVTLFNRGLTNTELFPDVEKRHGDRDGDLDALGDRSWDAVVDTSGYVPRIVRATTERLVDRVDRYAFVSSISVYADTSRPGVDESASVLQMSDEGDENVKTNYGGLKAACERVVQNAFGDRGVIIRPGLIVGPHDPTGRFTYWVTRIAEGGRVLAPEPRDQPIQLIDVRDLSAWILDALETSRSGVYNVTGPALPLTMHDALEAIAEAVAPDAELEWVDEAFLVSEDVEPWSELPLWLAPQTNETSAGFLSIDISRALDAGLRLRPLSDTATDTLGWATRRSEEAPVGRLQGVGLDTAREAALLQRWDDVRASR